MNAVRRARIRDVIEQIKTLERTVSRILNEEKAAYENLPDNIEHFGVVFFKQGDHHFP